MDLSFSPEEEAFRQEVRDFIAEVKPKLPKNWQRHERCNCHDP